MHKRKAETDFNNGAVISGLGITRFDSYEAFESLAKMLRKKRLPTIWLS